MTYLPKRNSTNVTPKTFNLNENSQTLKVHVISTVWNDVNKEKNYNLEEEEEEEVVWMDLTPVRIKQEDLILHWLQQICVVHNNETEKVKQE